MGENYKVRWGRRVYHFKTKAKAQKFVREVQKEGFGTLEVQRQVKKRKKSSRSSGTRLRIPGLPGF